jgi:hypothetical protein
MVRVVPIAAVPAVRALGFLAGRGVVTADVKAPFAAEIDQMFGMAS